MLALQDEVVQYFEDVLPYTDFSVRVPQCDIPRLDAILRSVPQREVARLQVRCRGMLVFDVAGACIRCSTCCADCRAFGRLHVNPRSLLPSHHLCLHGFSSLWCCR